jgi:SHS2 domain-containing protein
VAVRYLDHASEVGVEATGPTPEEAVAEAARGLFGIQVDRTLLRPERYVEVDGTGRDLPACLVDLLNACLARQDLEGLLFTARAGGVPAERVAEHRLTEVKAVTYQGLLAGPMGEEFRIRFVADV